MKRNGRKILGVLTALLLAVVMIGAAAAETVKPLPVQHDIANLKDCFVTTDITYKGKGMVTLSLYENEEFDAEAVKAVKEGDVIVTENQEIPVETVTWDGPDVYFNKGKDNEMLFTDTGKGTFEHVKPWNDLISQALIGTLEQEILPYMTMIDSVDLESGEPLEQFVLKTGEDLLAMLESGDGPCFDVKNVRILYDNNNQPTLIWRYYSPLQ